MTKELEFVQKKDLKWDIKAWKRLYVRSFPLSERVPFPLLKMRAKGAIAEMISVYDGEVHVGLLYLVHYKDIVFIWFLAIDENIRGKGYGSRILAQVTALYPKARIGLNIEHVDPQAAHFEERQQRKHFYLKNGYRENGLVTKELNVVFEMLVKNENIAFDEYEKLCKRFAGPMLYRLIFRGEQSK